MPTSSNNSNSNNQLEIRRKKPSQTLLPTPVARAVSSVSSFSRLSLRTAHFISQTFFDVCRVSTSCSLEISRDFLISAVHAARQTSSVLVHNRRLTDAVQNNSEQQQQLNVVPTLTDSYADYGINALAHSFSVAELGILSAIEVTQKLTNNTIKTAEEIVRYVDGYVLHNTYHS